MQDNLRQQLTRSTTSLALIPRRVTTTHVRVHTGVDHFRRIRRVTAVGITDRVQRETQTLLMGGDEVPAVLDPFRETPNLRQ
ncbi:hypothetical protein D3C86_1498080 [compost metagenome]